MTIDGLGSRADDGTRFTHPGPDAPLFATAERELGPPARPVEPPRR
ncbi:hypothetical protein ACIHCX_21530 [Streptomyces sp. NPDC052043]